MDTTAIDNSSDDINDVESIHPFKVFKNKEYKNNDEGQLDLCAKYVRLLSSRDRCKNCTNNRKKFMSCNCLGFLDNHFYWEATGNWMVDFGSMKRHDQQRVVIEKIRHADSLAESVGDSLDDDVEEDVDPDVLTDVDPAIVENEYLQLPSTSSWPEHNESFFSRQSSRPEKIQHLKILTMSYNNLRDRMLLSETIVRS
jgi:hypothetical protein